MNRDELFQIAIAAGWQPGKRLTQAQRTTIVYAIRDVLSAPDALADARVHESQTSRPMEMHEAVKALLEELS